MNRVLKSVLIAVVLLAARAAAGAAAEPSEHNLAETIERFAIDSVVLEQGA